MGQTGDQLRQELDQTRENASQKIDEIQDRVEDATQKVKDTFDVRMQIEERPLIAAGVAVAGGFLLGSLMGGGDKQHHENAYQTPESRRMYAGAQSHESHGGMMGAIHNAAKSTGLDDTLNAMAASVVGALTDQLKNMASEAIPGFSQKFEQAQQTPGGFSQKTHAVEESGARYPSSQAGYADDITSATRTTQPSFNG
ncbi:MAG TPA: hypothetical protein VFL82_09950 [Thermomicrobiales bacterium]|nr:hypothetical protein [Thermomicrobiales bacterium]